MRGNVVNGIDIAEHVGIVEKALGKLKWAPSGSMCMDDLRQAGLLGLVRAAEKFEPERGLKFTTYARHWVRSFVHKEIFASRRTVYVPANQLNKPENKDDMDRIGKAVSLESVELGGRNGECQQQVEIGDVLGMLGHYHEPEPSSDRLQLHHMLNRTVGLKARNIEAIYRRLGKDDQLKEIGDDYGTTHENIRQLVNKTVARIRNANRIVVP